MKYWALETCFSYKRHRHSVVGGLHRSEFGSCSPVSRNRCPMSRGDRSTKGDWPTLLLFRFCGTKTLATGGIAPRSHSTRQTTPCRQSAPLTIPTAQVTPTAARPPTRPPLTGPPTAGHANGNDTRGETDGQVLIRIVRCYQ